MEIVAHTGVVLNVIDAINAAFLEGPLATVKTIVLTRAEMDEFMANHNFKCGVGKMYGDADVPSLMHIKNAADGKTVIEFFLAGILVQAPPA